MTEELTLTSQLIETGEVFQNVIAMMHKEGNGLITAQAFASEDASKLIIGALMGLIPKGPAMLYIMECDKFLKTLETSSPTCSAGDCTNQLHKHEDVGCIVILHGMTDTPTAVIAAGVCESCWKEKLDQDTDKAMDSFLSYLRQCLPGMKSFKKEEFEQRFAGNAPTSNVVN